MAYDAAKARFVTMMGEFCRLPSGMPRFTFFVDCMLPVMADLKGLSVKLDAAMAAKAREFGAFAAVPEHRRELWRRVCESGAQ